MSGNTLGTLFCITSFGESHGPAIGCVVDGCPPGMALAASDIQHDLDRRKPGTSRHVTQRRESDSVEILSGVFEGRTTGTPIALLIRNEDPRSKDYSNIADTFRPGHADYTYWQKYGIRDYRGGGRQSARETAVRVAAGAIARKWLRERYGVLIRGHLTAAGDQADTVRGLGARRREPVLRCQRQHRCRTRSLHGRACASRATPAAPGLSVVAEGVPVGWGEPVYGKLDADLAGAMMGINAVKGVEIGAGFAERRPGGQRALRRDDAGRLPVESRRRHPRRDFDRPGHHRFARGQADLVDPARPAQHRQGRQRRSSSTRMAGTTPAWAFARRRSRRPCWRSCSWITRCATARRMPTWSAPGPEDRRAGARGCRSRNCGGWAPSRIRTRTRRRARDTGSGAV